MGHLLSSVNPQAAAEIETPPALPDIGTPVVYIARAGFGRMGRSEFPALVTHHMPENTVELMVMIEPEDMMVERHVQFQSHNQPHHCWRYRSVTDREAEFLLSAAADRLNDQAQRIVALEAEIKFMQKAMEFGDKQLEETLALLKPILDAAREGATPKRKTKGK